MATIIITVRTGNAAMQTWDDAEEALGDAITAAVERFSGEPREGQSVGVWDVNGNRVGQITVTDA